MKIFMIMGVLLAFHSKAHANDPCQQLELGQYLFELRASSSAYVACVNYTDEERQVVVLKADKSGQVVELYKAITTESSTHSGYVLIPQSESSTDEDGVELVSVRNGKYFRVKSKDTDEICRVIQNN